MKFNNKNLTKLLINNYNNKINNYNSYNESAKQKQKDKNKENINNIFEQREHYILLNNKKNNFKNRIKKSLLKEALYFIYNKSMLNNISENTDILQKNLINEFVEKEGTSNILRKFKSCSYILSEYARIIEKYTTIFINESKKEKNYDDIINIDTKNKFYDELDLDDINQVQDEIRTRVANSLDEFIVNNAQDKSKIKETLQNAKEKIDKTTKKEIQESFNLMGKRSVTNIKKRPKTVLESIIYNISNACYKNKDLKNIYIKNNELDLDLVIENSLTLYTFLELLNTSKIKNINEQTISNFLDNLK